MQTEGRRELIERLERGPGEEIRIFLTEGGIDIQLFRQTPEGEWVLGEERLEIPLPLLDRFQEILHGAEENSALAAEPTESRAPFANASEEEFTRILDFYQIEWEYEPRSFPLEQDGNGEVTESFTPDFYLPQFDLYIELTTLKQDLVTKKNRKIRRLRELYPTVNLKVFYGRDYRKLLERFGIVSKE
ncbi:MAG: hypothetical protein O6926_09290 [candidate division NC10 bacterium]|nr:hypothetical protein [candidate division NC10 bacterium]